MTTPCSQYVLDRFPKPCRPRQRRRCRICGQIIAVKEPCCQWSGVEPGEGWWTAYAHPECYHETKDMHPGDFEDLMPGDISRPYIRMAWP